MVRSISLRSRGRQDGEVHQPITDGLKGVGTQTRLLFSQGLEHAPNDVSEAAATIRDECLD